MKIDKIKIENFKCFEGIFEVSFNPNVNIIVGDNESGKTTILEAIHIALTGLMNGRYLRNELNANLFNIATQTQYLNSLSTKNPQSPPRISIEIFFSGSDPLLASHEGDGNSEKSKSSGIVFTIEFDEDYLDEYNALISTKKVTSLPIEYYKTSWYSFARKSISGRTVPIKSALIDSSSVRLQNGSDLYVGRIVKELLDDSERVAISQAHRHLRDEFANNDSIERINKKINQTANISQKPVSISVDLSSQSAWEHSLTTYIDHVPFQYIGKGEQCIVKTKLALSAKKANESTILLIEEPENHLSHANLNRFISEIVSDNGEKQIIMSTHSSFVANKLGLKNLILVRNGNTVKITELTASDFFEKLAGYDTLRLVLSRKAILVEGDSDELIVQKAYKGKNDNRLPIDDGIDVISVGTSFLRFLELAKALGVKVAVVTDNDGDLEAVEKKYSTFLNCSGFKICYDDKVDTGDLVLRGKSFNYNTLEPKLLKANNLTTLNKVFSRKDSNEDEMLIYMNRNKPGFPR